MRAPHSTPSSQELGEPRERLLELIMEQRGMHAKRRTGTAGRILEVSIVMFARRGYAGTSMRDVAKQVDIKAASIYEYFDNKTDLLYSGLVQILEQFYGFLLDALSPTESPSSQLESVLKRHLEWQSERETASAWDALWDFHIVDGLTPKLSADIYRYRSLYREYIVALVAHEIPHDEQARMRAEAALYLCNTMNGWVPTRESTSEVATLGWTVIRRLLQPDQVAPKAT